MLDLAELDAALKDDYTHPLISVINNTNKLLKYFPDVGDQAMSADGRQAVYPVHVGRNSGVGFVGENKNIPVATNQELATAKVPYRYAYLRIELTGQSIKLSKTDKGSFVRGLTLEMKNGTKDLNRNLNRALWGTGTGMLCRVSTTQSAGTAIAIKDPYGIAGTIGSGRLIQAGDVLAAVRSATPSSATDSDIVSGVVKAVSSLSSDLNTITFTATTGATLNDNDFFVLAPAGTGTTTESSLNKECMGLLGIIDDGSNVGTLHNISRTTYPQYKSTIISLNGDFSFDAVWRAEDKAEEQSGEETNLILSHHSVRREYKKLLVKMMRFLNDSTKDAGDMGKVLEFDNKPWHADRMAPYGMIFGMNTKNNVQFVATPGEWADDDTGRVLLRSSTKDTYEGRFRKFFNVTNDRPDGCWRIDGVTATVDAIAAE